MTDPGWSRSDAIARRDWNSETCRSAAHKRKPITNPRGGSFARFAIFRAKDESSFLDYSISHRPGMLQGKTADPARARARARCSALPFCLSSFLMLIPAPGCAPTHKFRNPDRWNDGYIATDGPLARKIDDDGDTLE